MGIIDDQTNKEKLAKLARFSTTYNTTELFSIDDYISRAKENQDSIYFLAGDKKEEMVLSPIIKGLIRKKYEVLLMTDPLDEYVFQKLTEYKSKKFVNISKSDFKFPEDDDERKLLKKLSKYYQPLTDWMRGLLEKKVESVRVSLKMEKDPMIVMASGQGYSP